jgi:hypothetical protein
MDLLWKSSGFRNFAACIFGGVGPAQVTEGLARIRCLTCVHGQDNGKGRTQSRFALGSQVTARDLAELLADRQPEATATILVRGARIGLCESSNNLPSCSGVMPTPVSLTTKETEVRRGLYSLRRLAHKRVQALFKLRGPRGSLYNYNYLDATHCHSYGTRQTPRESRHSKV